MAKQRNRGRDNSKPVTCERCQLEAVAPPGSQHRRCGGKKDAPRLPRGTWAQHPGFWQS